MVYISWQLTVLIFCFEIKELYNMGRKRLMTD